jgi:tripartite-type tricarboxylate transporter receptor subunit TctC
MNRKLLVLIMVIGCLCLYSAGTQFEARAADWPSKPITIIVGWGAGGTTDLITRMLADSLQGILGVPVVVENKPGGAGLIALGLVSKAKPDGYTLGSLSLSGITEKPFVTEVPFDPVNGFSHICQIFNYGYGFVVKSDSPWKTFQEFVDDAKSKPGQLTVSMSGLGSTMHVALAKLEQKLPGFKITPIPYEGGLAAVTALLGGHVNACFQTQEWVPHVDAGTLRLLAIPAKEGMRKYPDVPTWLDLGYGVYGESPGAYVAPAGLSEEIRSKLESAFEKALKSEKVQDTIEKFALVESFRPGNDVYADAMKLFEENKTFIPTLPIAQK